MLKPITLTVYGETLRSYDGSTVGDDGELSCVIGVHDICRGFIDIRDVSKTHKVLICRSCSMRVVVPNRVKKYADLRNFLIGFQNK